MSKHTPIPYRIERNHSAGNVVHLAILGADDDMPCSITPMAWCRPVDEANAEFICRACNNHEKLVNVLANLIRCIERDNLHTTHGVKLADARAAIALTEPSKPVSTTPKK